MFIDYQLVMSAAQEFTAQAEAISTNIIDLGVAGLTDKVAGEADMTVVARVQTTFTSEGAATLVCLIETDTDSAFGSAVALHTSATHALASLVAGFNLAVIKLPQNVERYIRCTYTVATADMTAGAVDAFLVKDYDTSNIS